jgi:hypothetical protein
MEEFEHSTSCLWQHVKLLRGHVDASLRTRVGYPPKDTSGAFPRFVNFAPTCYALELCTRFADYRTNVGLVSPGLVRRDPFSLPLPDSPVANTSDHNLTRLTTCVFYQMHTMNSGRFPGCAIRHAPYGYCSFVPGSG